MNEVDKTPPTVSSNQRRYVPDHFGRLYGDDCVQPGGMAGTWVRRAEVDVLLDEIEQLLAGRENSQRINDNGAREIERLTAALERVSAEAHGVGYSASLDFHRLGILSIREIAQGALSANPSSAPETSASPAEDLWMRLLADVNAEPCRWPGLRNELRDWQRVVRGDLSVETSDVKATPKVEHQCNCGMHGAPLTQHAPHCALNGTTDSGKL